MAADYELRLHLLTPGHPGCWQYKSLTFDLSGVTDVFLLPWTVQGLEVGLVAARSSDAVAAEVTSLLGDGAPRTIKIYSSGADFVAGTGLSVGPMYGSVGASGASVWLPPIAHRNRSTERPTPPAKRSNLRMFLNPTGGSGMSLPGEDGAQHPTYSSLIGTLWHELHHMAASDYEQHLRGSPPYEPYWQAAIAAIRAGFPSGAWDPISRKMVPLWTSQWASIQCHCLLA